MAHINSLVLFEIIVFNIGVGILLPDMNSNWLSLFWFLGTIFGNLMIIFVIGDIMGDKDEVEKD